MGLFSNRSRTSIPVKEVSIEFGSFALPYREGEKLQEAIQRNDNISYSWIYGRENDLMVFDNLTIIIEMTPETLFGSGLLPTELVEFSRYMSAEVETNVRA